MGIYDLFRDEVTWRPSLGDPEYPGAEPLGPEQTIPVREVGVSMVRLGGDAVQRRIWWTLPEHEVSVGDTLDGHKVTELAGEVKDHFGNLIHRVWYGEA